MVDVDRKMNRHVVDAIVTIANSPVRNFTQFFFACLDEGLKCKRIIKCDQCGRYSSTIKTTKKYCEDQCRWDANNGKVGYIG